MATIDIVRSFAVAAFPGSTVVLNLSNGTFFHLERESTSTALDIARELPSAEIEERMANDRKIPRYVARERVRALQLQLASPFTLASSPRLGQSSFVDVGGSVHIGEQAGVLRPGESVRLRGAALRNTEGITFIGGGKGSGKTVLASALQERGCELLDDGAVFLPLGRGGIAVPLANAWFVDSQRRPGMGLILARRSPAYVMGQLLGHTTSTHARGAWVEIFRVYAKLAEELPAFRVTLPEGIAALQSAVAEFAASAGGFRPHSAGVGS